MSAMQSEVFEAFAPSTFPRTRRWRRPPRSVIATTMSFRSRASCSWSNDDGFRAHLPGGDLRQAVHAL